MRIILIEKNELLNFLLPQTVDGNYWITDIDNSGEIRNLINIESINHKWVAKNNYETKILYNNKEFESIELKPYSFYVLKINNENIIMYTSLIYDNTYTPFSIENNHNYIIGKSDSADICFKFNMIEDNHANIIYNGKWYIEDNNSKFGVYVNNIRVKKKQLDFGDIIFISGLKIILMKDYILMNKIGNLVTTKLPSKNISFNQNKVTAYDENANIKPLYDSDEYFHKSPRFKTAIEKESISIDPPPAKNTKDELPMVYTLGPMITMGMTSVVNAFTAINNMTTNNQSFVTILPTLILAFAMLATMLFWPLLTKKYEKKRQLKKDKERLLKYSKYVNSKRQRIVLMSKLQSQVLKDNYISLEECSNIIVNKKSNLWNRDIEQNDFLSLRVGIGNYPLQVEIDYNEEDFTMEEDELKKEVEELARESRDLIDVPISFSLTEKFVCGIVANNNLAEPFLNGLLLQMVTFHGYDQLKIVFLTSEKNNYKWESIKNIPHIFSNDKSVRFYATNIGEMKELSLYLERIYQSRKGEKEGEATKFDYHKNPPYYVIITDDYETARDLEIIKDILEQEVNQGFSLLIVDNRLSKLPNECESFINVGELTSGIFESEVVSTNQREFTADLANNIDLKKCFNTLANTPIELLNEDTNLPSVLGFLEMYKVGKVEHLNILNRWLTNSTITSLQAPLGVDRTGEILFLDLHEKIHGPHGLIAGMTGSGKSELIITYILSLAVNYHPNDIALVLIDYKGGGLAGAFQNKETGMKLPHLAGTITNLDVSDMNRSLVSIQSELRRRQSLFNEARDSLNESMVDIYKYQRLFKEGKVKEPIPHLIIISDEFAELKSQQPEFMDQLISTARIGRSLGVHLILATQKPSGVVNDQIWSNSKFRVCLKVQEKQDSMEMIKCPDAAALKNVGRFYLQVGYNELFTLGQSAWCGTKYYPTDKIRKKIDSKIDFIDNIGNIIKSVDNEKQKIESQGEEITNIVSYICNIAKEKNIHNRNLWLDKIPHVIFTEDLIKKYDYKNEPYIINPVIGEYDDPFNQRQGILTINLTSGGNTLIFGMAGSGKELLLISLICSVIQHHSVEEVNLYLLDFGTEALKMFNNAPQVGDYISLGDDEKIDKFLRMIEEEFEIRKEKFSNYSGDYNVYIKNSQEKLPLILIFINNYDNFAETYDMYFERLSAITREGVKYGIVTIMTAVGVSSTRYKLRQNFPQQLALQLNDELDYMSIFGKYDKTVIDTCKGRGLVKIDGVYEYQVSYPYIEDEFAEKIKDLCDELKAKYTIKAKRIPILPDIVDVDYVLDKISGLKNVPIGVAKETLEIIQFNFAPKNLSIISAQDVYITTGFLNSLFNVLTKANNLSPVVLDNEDIITYRNEKMLYYNDNFGDIINQLYNGFNEKKVYEKTFVCAIIGIEGLLSKIDVEVKTKLTELFKISKENECLKFILIDSTSKLKKLEYEAWYKDGVVNTNGIYIGSGIANQYVISINKLTSQHREDIPDNFGYTVVNGRTTLVKLLEDHTDE